MRESSAKLRTAQNIAFIVGAVGSTALMLYHARNNTHLVITIGYVGWVLGPFAVLAWGAVKSRAWNPRAQRLVAIMTFVVTIASLATYVRGAFWPMHPAAFPFTITPPVLVALSVVVLLVASRHRASG